MTAPAETHEVAFVIGSSFRDRNDVVDFLDRNIPSVFKTFFAERMLVHIPRPDLSPLAAVTFVSVVTSGEVIVMLLHQFFVGGAVLFAVIAKFFASGIAARAFRFSWHFSSPHALRF
jgi:hypothetical protein